MLLTPAQVHSEQHIGPVLRFGAARTRLYVEVAIAAVVRAGEHAAEFQHFQLLYQFIELTFRFVEGVFVFGFYG